MVTIHHAKKSNNRPVRVTFTMPALKRCGSLYLIGHFNNCNESVYRMQQADDGSWFITLELETGREYSYGFRTDDGTWLEDMLPPSQVFRPNNTLDQVKSQEAEISKVTFSVPEPY
jgi:1,4-alpha-glucan branching enzyme